MYSNQFCDPAVIYKEFNPREDSMVYIQKVGISHFVNYFIRLIYVNYFLWPPSLGDLKTDKGKLKLFSLLLEIN